MVQSYRAGEGGWASAGTAFGFHLSTVIIKVGIDNA